MDNCHSNDTERCAANAASVRDLHPGGFLLVTLDGMWTPMRPVGFGDINIDHEAGIPLIFTDDAEAEARATAWNERLPPEFRDALDICAMPVDRWYPAYMDTLDPDELDFEGSVEWSPPVGGIDHPEAARIEPEHEFDEEAYDA